MNRHYAGRDWQKLAGALQVMREQLLAAGVLIGAAELGESRLRDGRAA